jgi:hypothetical protein
MSLCKSGGLVDPGLVLTIAHDELDKRSVNRKSTVVDGSVSPCPLCACQRRRKFLVNVLHARGNHMF